MTLEMMIQTARLHTVMYLYSTVTNGHKSETTSPFSNSPLFNLVIRHSLSHVYPLFFPSGADTDLPLQPLPVQTNCAWEKEEKRKKNWEERACRFTYLFFARQAGRLAV